MYHYFNQLFEANNFVSEFNKDKGDNQPKAKIMAWPCDSIKRNNEWIVFTPKQI